MNPVAVAHAKQRLRKAEKAVVAILNAKNFEDAESAWADFLMATASIYTKLQEGAKGHKKSEPWFGTKKNERKNDPLLRYLHFARNSAEHGVDRVAGITQGDTHPTRGLLGFNQRSYGRMQKLNKATRMPEGPEVEFVQSGPTLKPIRVYDRRYNDYCDPPHSHLGRRIYHSFFIDSLAETAIGYLRSLVEEAESMVD